MTLSDGTKPRKAVPYLRVSTDDKGQDPKRQMSLIGPWGVREGVKLEEPFIDEGTSADKTAPFDRPVFRAACERAQEVGAQAIVVETGDRFTRKGTRMFFVYAYQLEEKYGLKLWEADQTISQQDSGLGEIVSAIKAMAAKEWLETHRRRSFETIAKRRARGDVLGRPSKTFSPDEERFVLKHRDVPKSVQESWDWIANELSKARGAFEVTDKLARSRRMVSEGHVRRLYKKLKGEALLEPQNPVGSPDSVKSPNLKVESQ